MSASMTKLHHYGQGNRLAATFGRRLLGALLPIECLACGVEGEWLCRDCRQALTITRAITCVICAKAADDGLCGKCRRLTKLDGTVSLFAYRQQGVQRLVKAVKFSGYTDALNFYVEQYGELLVDRLNLKKAALVAVPLSRERLRERGFNQAALICELLARRYGLSVWPGLLRNRHTKAQAELRRLERSSNVKGAFSTTVGETAPERVILVDDVITTGATLAEAAKTLRQAGSKVIVALTLAHG